MTKKKMRETDNNPFKKLLDDAGRSLADVGGLDFLDELASLPEDGGASIPFPYGVQPEGRCGWN